MASSLRFDDPSCEIYQFALEAYKRNRPNKHSIDLADFQSEYQRYWYFIKLLVIFRNKGESNIRLLFNHLIILTNNFGQEASQILLKLAIEKGDYVILSYVLTILNIVGYVPENMLIPIMGDEYLLSDITLDKHLENSIIKELS